MRVMGLVAADLIFDGRPYGRQVHTHDELTLTVALISALESGKICTPHACVFLNVSKNSGAQRRRLKNT